MARAFELGGFLRANRDAIIARWADSVLLDRGVPEAQRLDRRDLVNHLPEMLDDVASALSDECALSSAGDDRDVAVHAQKRVEQGYSLASATREIALLRSTIVRLRDESGMSFQAEEEENFHRVLDEMLARMAMVMEEAHAHALGRERDAAVRANADKDAFLSFLSHEVRNALNAILGWTRIARADAARCEKALDVIERNGLRLSKLTEDLLDFRRAALDKTNVDQHLVDLRAVARHAVEAAEPRAADRRVGLSLEADPEPALVCGDSERLMQLVSNLLENGLKFTPEGGHVRIRVETASDEVRVSVMDTGVGIASDVLPTIFEPFRQGDAGQGRRHGGLGLGLALVDRIAQLHGGRARADSAGQGHGATFVVTLPRWLGGAPDPLAPRAGAGGC